jgi:isochorismate pyruvate lyase
MARTVPPHRLANLSAVRARIDAIDRKLAPLLAQRFACVGRAAHFKRDAAAAAAPVRARKVIARACALARRHGAPPQAVAEVYRALIRTGVALERQSIAKRKKT